MEHILGENVSIGENKVFEDNQSSTHCSVMKKSSIERVQVLWSVFLKQIFDGQNGSLFSRLVDR